MVKAVATTTDPAKPLTAESIAGDAIQLGHPLFGIAWVNAERVSGAPSFAGTRVPVKNYSITWSRTTP